MDRPWASVHFAKHRATASELVDSAVSGRSSTDVWHFIDRKLSLWGCPDHITTIAFDVEIRVMRQVVSMHMRQSRGGALKRAGYYCAVNICDKPSVIASIRSGSRRCR